MPDPEVSFHKMRNHRNLDDSRFYNLYQRFVSGNNLEDSEFVEMLRFAILFLRLGDPIVAQLGYRIILQYSIQTRDFDALLEVARTREFMPIVETIKTIQEFESSAVKESFIEVFDDAYRRLFEDNNGVMRTQGQLRLRTMGLKEEKVLVVAPTSYGKSEIMIERALDSRASRICILVPSKALIAQTKYKVYRSQRKAGKTARIITHPEAYNHESEFIAILTQERLHRLFVEDSELTFGEILVDEAQNILSQGHRAIELSTVLFVARARNSEVRISYFTPFLEQPERLQHLNNLDEGVKSAEIHEAMKSEVYLYGVPGGTLMLYDQYLNRHIATDEVVGQSDVEAIKRFAGKTTLVYVNKPRDAENLAVELADQSPSLPESAVLDRGREALAELIHPEYKLIRLIGKGVLYHHGRMPETIRQYVEYLFRDSSTKYQTILVSTSTLLEGVNTPADRMIIASPQRGRRHLTPAGFRNLVGRVGRLGTIFDPSSPRLDLLLPRILLLKSRFARSDWNVETFLGKTADISKSAVEPVENPLLQASGDDQGRIDALVRLENIEEGASELTDPRRVLTRIGQLCFHRGVTEFDVFRFEQLLTDRTEQLLASNKKASDPAGVIQLIISIFFDEIEIDGGEKELQRLKDSQSAQSFHSMHLHWRVRGASMQKMIASYLHYWRERDDRLVYVSSSWGEVPGASNEHRDMYIRPAEKTNTELINLAVVRIKEENDFIDYKLMKFVDILIDLNLIEHELSERIKYGTNDDRIICLLRNGFSRELAVLVAGNGELLRHVSINTSLNEVVIQDPIVEVMGGLGMNDILIYEMQTLIGR